MFIGREVPAEDVSGTLFETQQPQVSEDVHSVIESIGKLKADVEGLRSLLHGHSGWISISCPTNGNVTCRAG